MSLAKYSVILLSLFIMGCSVAPKRFNIQKTSFTATKRINTTACKDSDDWYLDGYRVGKSFEKEKLQMLKQRSDYCGYHLERLPQAYRKNWEQGFHIGARK